MSVQRSISSVPVIITLMLVAIIGIEAVLQAADKGLVGTVRWRSLAYQFGAFWPGLLDTWQPNYPGQAVTMFATYAFLHSGLDHMVGNAITLWVLGHHVVTRTGQRGFLAIYVLTSFGGALCFAGLSPGTQPMLGASGALFGLAGILCGWEWRDGPRSKGALLRLLAIIIGLILMNVALYWWHNGYLAWETHLGGFVTGLALAGWFRTPRRPRADDPAPTSGQDT